MAKMFGGTSSEFYGNVQVIWMENFCSLCNRSNDGMSRVVAKEVAGCKIRFHRNILWNQRYGGSYRRRSYSLQLKGSKLLISVVWFVDGDLTHNYGKQDAWILLTDTSGKVIFSQATVDSVDEFWDANLLMIIR